MNLIRSLWVMAALSTFCVPAIADPVPRPIDIHWNQGAADCRKTPQPPLQVFQYDPQTYILRESPCATFEAPFMYVLIGTDRALMIDTGDVADPTLMPLARTVMGLLPGQGAAKLPLLVVHTHGHLDHRAGDPQFQALPNVQVVGTDLQHVKQYFGFNHWPDGVDHIDLGHRVVDVIPTPGHYPSHVSYYDRNTALFFSGDFFMPARLIIDNTAEDIASAKRVAEFIRNRPVTYVLGGHIEVDANGDTFDFGSTYHPNEHVLQLDKQDLMGLPAIVGQFNGFYNQRGMYVMMNQYRVLAAQLAALLLIVAGVVVMIWRFVRHRRRRRRAMGN
ncbi:MBL fold metallo-hydrolase [Dyella jejuensis]|uniref:MBL fold metallo-hydrolase n=1 Tax=Dyella jejuensis TaxID=1432009 RepID=A0ABW8JKE6_9GAMM